MMTQKLARVDPDGNVKACTYTVLTNTVGLPSHFLERIGYFGDCILHFNRVLKGKATGKLISQLRILH